QTCALPIFGSEVLDPLARLRALLSRDQGELVALRLGGGLRFGRTERGEPLLRMPTTQFGVGGYGQVALGAGGGIPLGPVGHRGGEHGLALPVDLVQRVVAAGEFLLPRGGVVFAAAAGGLGFGAGAEGGQVSVPGGGADLAQLVTDVPGRPGGLDGVGV